jgi:hypothetical protein
MSRHILSGASPSSPVLLALGLVLLAPLQSAHGAPAREQPVPDAMGTVWSNVASHGMSHAILLEEGQALGLGFSVGSTDGSPSTHKAGELGVPTSARLETITLRLGVIPRGAPEFCDFQRCASDLPHAPDEGMLTVGLFEGRAPGDGRPHGKRIAQIRVPIGSLPLATYTWYDVDAREEVDLAALVRSGTTDGIWWRKHPGVSLNVSPAVDEFTLGLSMLDARLESGKAYSLVLGVEGGDLIVLEGLRVATPLNSGVAFRAMAGREMQPQALAIGRSLDGLLEHTPRERQLKAEEIGPTEAKAGNERQGNVAVSDESGAAGSEDPTYVEQMLTATRETLLSAVKQGDVPVVHLTGRVLVQDTELQGLIVIGTGAEVFFDNVVLEGCLVSEAVFQRPGTVVFSEVAAPRVTIDGNLRIEPMGALPGVAVVLPDGRITTSPGITPGLQIGGDILAHDVSLDGAGAVRGVIASMGALHVAKSVRQHRARAESMLASMPAFGAGTGEL